MLNRCVPGGIPDPLTPNSMRLGDKGCRNILAGGGGWASSPTEGGGNWSAPSSSALRASAPIRPTRASNAAKRPVRLGLCIRPLPEVTPRQMSSGVDNQSHGGRRSPFTVNVT
jgi:hypothetical protein